MTEGHVNCSRGKSSCITCCIDEIFTEFYASKDNSGFGPTSLLNASWKINRSLAGYSEQDAHEFFQFLINHLHQDITQTNTNISIDENKDSSRNNSHSTKKHNSPCSCIIHKTFSSDLQSSITCLECNNVTNTIDPIIDISLEISPNATNLVDCLRNFTRNEKLDIKYNCSNCHSRTNAMKKLSILKFPNVLAFQLKRFKHDNFSVKLENIIKFPSFLNVSEFATNAQSSTEIDPELNYELFGIVCHIGSVNTGHYIALVKNIDGQWFKCDDSIITMITTEQALSVKAYLLFYIVHKL